MRSVQHIRSENSVPDLMRRQPLAVPALHQRRIRLHPLPIPHQQHILRRHQRAIRSAIIRPYFHQPPLRRLRHLHRPIKRRRLAQIHKDPRPIRRPLLHEDAFRRLPCVQRHIRIRPVIPSPQRHQIYLVLQQPLHSRQFHQLIVRHHHQRIRIPACRVHIHQHPGHIRIRPLRRPRRHASQQPARRAERSRRAHHASRRLRIRSQHRSHRCCHQRTGSCTTHHIIRSPRRLRHPDSIRQPGHAPQPLWILRRKRHPFQRRIHPRQPARCQMLRIPCWHRARSGQLRGPGSPRRTRSPRAYLHSHIPRRARHRAHIPQHRPAHSQRRQHTADESHTGAYARHAILACPSAAHHSAATQRRLLPQRQPRFLRQLRRRGRYRPLPEILQTRRRPFHQTQRRTRRIRKPPQHPQLRERPRAHRN